jgi:hypothetical protein
MKKFNIDESLEVVCEAQRARAKEFVEHYQESNKDLNAVGMIMKLGEVFSAGDQKRSNDWKARMLKAGLGNKGLIMPDDWDTLTEDEKEKRLNGVIGILTKQK